MDIKNHPGNNILQGKSAVITGAGSGIGKATVFMFLKEGANCVAADLNSESVLALKDEFPEYADRIRPYSVDVSQRDQVEDMIDYAVKEFGKMDIIFNNAGVMDGMAPVGELSDGMWERVMNINVKGVMYACRKAVQYFLERGEGGVILNTASLGGLYGARAGLAYTASKFAVVGMTKNIAFMYSKDGIRCNAICPGGVQTNITQSMMLEYSEKGAEITSKGMGLMPRMGDPYEVASAAVFLSCGASTLVNGSALIIDGGWSSY